MYLKSLVLKGFKSFADRSVLTLEPGITAVVGPNGSGKSNISDAVLWVLGERNAKHLRGQAMEDVIFAGSSARKVTGLAEVDLVLDNSDGTLPVEFDEVAITRRMYRSGESEYLINGCQARRMDVLDILHDSGLGTGTHSIISQGSLDSILQSKPEDRRALIEEAAGVLKHKQRKAKSERKLQQMDIHLTRAKDVVREVERQLGPLERKAKRAKAYESASAELAELTLALAVDDLRALKRAWEAACATERGIEQELERHRVAIADADERMRALQEQVRLDAASAGELERAGGRANTAVERLDGAMLLLHEKRRAAQRAEADVRVQLESDKAKRIEADAELSRALEQLARVSAERVEADASVAKLLQDQAANAEQRRALEKRSDEAERERKEAERDRESIRKQLAETQETLSSGIAHMKLVETRGKELELQLKRAQEDADRAAQRRAAADRDREQADSRDAQLRSAVASALAARNKAQVAADDARNAAAAVAAEVRGIEEVERASVAGNPAHAWVRERLRDLPGSMQPLSHAVRASEGTEALVETLLGPDVAALFVDDSVSALDVAHSVLASEQQGEVSVVPRADSARTVRDARAAAAACGGWALTDKVSCSQELRQALDALLGDVVVCDSVDAALAAHERRECAGLRIATLDGCVVWPNGKVSICSAALSDAEGALSRARALDQARAACAEAEKTRDKAAAALSEAEEALRRVQVESLQAAQELAERRGAAESARNEARRAEEQLGAVRREFESVQHQRKDAEKTVSQARPSVESLEARLAHATKRAEDGARASERAQAEVVPLRKAAARVRDALGEAKLRAATLAERETYTSRLVDARSNDIARIDEAEVAARATCARKATAQVRIEPLLATLEELAAAMRARASRAAEAAEAAQNVSSGLHGQVDTARAQAKAAHDAFDACNARLSEAKVSKGRLEVQVDTAVNVVVVECGTPLDHALVTPELTDRGSAEEAAFKLRRRIANMGTINPDAAKEYEQVRQRYDYLAAQLADLEGARRTLAKIVRVIDERMKDDFMRTYEAVNQNFQEIFAVLFPGGSAHLSLVGDTSDGEPAGVEVSAQPRGKRITKMMLMSGGEKSLTALALLFAVYRIRATPFYILDEVEAALDDSNLRRLTAYLENLRDSTQLIMITHQRRTMEMADVLFGVSMQADGVTKVISQKLDQALRSAQ
ncbi:chromosome segregation protein SMC [Adlercreutzia sp. ZJ141]|uniref:chromosome segregation protein SMC n=1 Tax=Adlercreutzia sp. ZJ141 TaxID=2709406 RepID=UPI0013ED150D|nr:chromosome segregation protein SMC [Adlercreutzia sp. ZJ141]